MEYTVTTAQLNANLCSLGNYKEDIDRAFEAHYASYKNEVLSIITNLKVSWLPWGDRITCPDELEAIEALLDREAGDLGWEDVHVYVGRKYGLSVLLKFRTEMEESRRLCNLLVDLQQRGAVIQRLIIAGSFMVAQSIRLSELEFSEYMAALHRYGV